jgi:UDP-N-acetylmuramoyl-L-alanyl-D-glutamate--2,6-diaminopimelate ligase
LRLSEITALGITGQTRGDVTITGLACDSRQVKPDYLFAAFKGVKTDGSVFITKAIESGAVAILTSPDVALPKEIPASVQILHHDNPRLVFAKLAAKFYAPQPETVVAITGTNGKTSVAHFCQQIWNALGADAASLGTLGVVVRDKLAAKEKDAASLTTPDSEFLHRTFHELAKDGVNHVAIEASSHGLDQYRLDGIRLKAAAFTNLSRDHLDYHETFEAYFAAKLRLFDALLPEGGTAVLNADIPEYATLCIHCEQRKHSIVSYGEKADTIRIRKVAPQANGSLVIFVINNVEYKVLLPLAGGFQVSNVLCALGLVTATGIDVDKAIGVLPTLRSVPGRMENVVTHPKGAGVYVDYAHTPDALEKALSSLRPHTAGKLVVVFGCGGDRDKGKRPQMGEVAARLADRIIVTDDNPRTENADSIRAQVRAGCPGAEEIADRAKAITAGVASLERGDVLLIAGKGHENVQIIGDKELPFDDTVVAFEAVSALRASTGTR